MSKSLRITACIGIGIFISLGLCVSFTLQSGFYSEIQKIENFWLIIAIFTLLEGAKILSKTLFFYLSKWYKYLLLALGFLIVVYNIYTIYHYKVFQIDRESIKVKALENQINEHNFVINGSIALLKSQLASVEKEIDSKLEKVNNLKNPNQQWLAREYDNKLSELNKKRDELVANITKLSKELKPNTVLNAGISSTASSTQALMFAILVELIIIAFCGVLGKMAKRNTLSLNPDELSLLQYHNKTTKQVHPPKVGADEQILNNNILKSKSNAGFTKGEPTENFDIFNDTNKENKIGEQGELQGELDVIADLERNNEIIKNCSELTGEQGELRGELKKNQGELAGEQKNIKGEHESELTAQVSNIGGEQAWKLENITGEMIKTIRTKLGFTQKVFASLICISKRYLIKIENGQANITKELRDRIYSKLYLSKN